MGIWDSWVLLAASAALGLRLEEGREGDERTGIVGAALVTLVRKRFSHGHLIIFSCSAAQDLESSFS